MEITFHSHLDSYPMIATKFCTWHDSCAVVACAKFCCDLMASKGITASRNFHWIWIADKKSLVKRAPAYILSEQLVVTIIATLRWASCGPVPGPQDAQRRVAIIVTKQLGDVTREAHSSNRLCHGDIAPSVNISVILDAPSLWRPFLQSCHA